jgi:hypothetical protein
LPVWPQVPRWQTRHRSNRAPGTKVAEWRGRGLRSERLPPLVLRDYHTGQHPSWRSADLGRGSRPVGRVAARTSRRLVLVVSPPAVGILSLPVKMQSVVRALTADTVIFEATTLSTTRPGGAPGRRANARPTEESIGVGNCQTRIRRCHNGSGPTRKADVDGYPHSPRPETRATVTITSAWTRCGMITQKVC